MRDSFDFLMEIVFYSLYKNEYSETTVLHHNADFTKNRKIKECVKSGINKENRRLVFLPALVLFIIKIKFTRYYNNNV